MRRSIYLLLIALLWNIHASAQNPAYYTILAGTFIDAKPQDFDLLRSYGFISVNEMDGNLYQVFVGNYVSKEEAQDIKDQLKTKGYTNAYIQERYLTDGETIIVIQVATRNRDQNLDYSEFERVPNLHGVLSGEKIKLVTGPYRSVDAAKIELTDIKSLGFKDAFIKKVNSIFALPVTEFETGLKKDLIPIEFSNKGVVPSRNRSNQLATRGAPAQGNDSEFTARSVEPMEPPVPTTVAAKDLPEIRSRVKRKSVMELQKALQSERAYSGKLDGYYGNGTEQAYQQALRNNRQLQKYAMLSEMMDPVTGSQNNNRLQTAINNLYSDPAAKHVLESSNDPVAKAYQAYLIFAQFGPNNEVNSLMNSAIREAYAGGRMQNQPPFDYRATYAYQDLEQLILHLHYIHSAPGNQYAAPCWLFEKYPNETAQAYETFSSSGTGNFTVQSCDRFLSWEEVRTMQTIASDLNAEHVFDDSKLSAAASRRAKLHLAPKPLNSSETRALVNWDDRIWTNMDAWASRDPLHQKLISALKISYHQSQVRLEDYYMDRGFNTEEAEGLALATLESLVGYHLERFI